MVLATSSVQTSYVITSVVCALVCVCHGIPTKDDNESAFELKTSRKGSEGCRLWTDCPDSLRMTCEHDKCVCDFVYDTKILDDGEIRCVDKHYGPNIGLFVGISIGGFVMVLIVACISWRYWRKRRLLLLMPTAIITTAPEGERRNNFSDTSGLVSNASPPYRTGAYPPPPPAYQPYPNTAPTGQNY